MKKQITSIVLILTMSLLILVGCSPKSNIDKKSNDEAPIVGNLKFYHSMDIKYAKNFKVDYYEGGYALLSLSNNTRFLVVPENMKVPQGLEEDIKVLQQPISNVYLVAAAIMPFFNDLDSLDAIRLSGTKHEGWYIDEVIKKMEARKILFAGKYSEPDFELIKSENCNLSIQSSMITHVPEIQEKLEELGLTVLIDQSSYEPHPLGKTEWIKFYSVLVDKEELGEELFNQQARVLDELKDIENTGKTVAFFFVNSSNSISARNSHDYIPKMIKLAGGNYIFESLGDPTKAISTTKMGMEEFYATTKDADYIIYNSTITGGVKNIKELVAKNELFANFKAVKEGNVWCTGADFYQSSNEFGTILGEFNTIITNNDKKIPQLKHFYKLK